MQILRVPTANGIDDIKLLGETEIERLFIKQLAEAGTLSCISRQVADSILFRAISVTPELSSYTSSKNTIGKYDFSVRQNETYAVDIDFSNGVAPINLTLFDAIKLQIKYSKSAPAIVELTIGNGLEVSGVNSNMLRVELTADQTKILTCDSYYYDILMSNPSSNIYYLEGKITVRNSVTR
jgi:hypothetical protein